MGAFFETIPKSLIQWILDQRVFWVSTVPLSGAGHVNVSPKGGAYFGVVNDTTFWYMDLSGSGNETISHLYEPGNGRITVLFNAFEGPPRILRLFGHGRVLENATREFNDFIETHNVTTIPGSRSIVVVDIHQVGTSCGYSVPFYDFKEFRPTLNEFFEKKAKKFAEGNDKESITRFWALNNAWSVDGLPGMQVGVKIMKEQGIESSKKMKGPHVMTNYSRPRDGFTVEQLLLAAVLGALMAVVFILYGLQIAHLMRTGLVGDAQRAKWRVPTMSH
ncbi:pyridoxamine phosphate oxidase family protein [Pseudomassariella vexata]|uniref:Pyridoxamine phosphate oxidase family protein n=1 Tax=Pseudomassariella vexata TaxID=1141098 RepID=A0A1Y2DMM8_9PEZI|nr:pyridoxamine phosphate oxidase family protein [Pseudomassariella vexata]ORY60501.1 pyridoxamine phosphate oxidase family protein [Pseudomassariella vexata]